MNRGQFIQLEQRVAALEAGQGDTSPATDLNGICHRLDLVEKEAAALSALVEEQAKAIDVLMPGARRAAIDEYLPPEPPTANTDPFAGIENDPPQVQPHQEPKPARKPRTRRKTAKPSDRPGSQTEAA